MFITAFLLFLVPFITAILVLIYSPYEKNINLKHLLTFSGSYLFSITLIHILPEIYQNKNNSNFLGLIVLGGFVFQMLLELMSKGIEHGHAHIHFHESFNSKKAIIMLVSLGAHSFVEGMILIHSSESHHNHDVQSLLIGLLIHKIPESFALTTSLIYSKFRSKKIFYYIIIHASCSPLGLFLANYIQDYFIDFNFVIYIFAVVSGSFLYLSTTIFFEQNPQHRLKPTRLIWFLLGAWIATLVHFFKI